MFAKLESSGLPMASSLNALRSLTSLLMNFCPSSLMTENRLFFNGLKNLSSDGFVKTSVGYF